MKRRKGNTLIDVIVSTALITFICIVVVQSTLAIDGMRAATRNTVFMSVHNLNCMERIRLLCQENPGGLLLYYGDDQMGSLKYETEVTLEPTMWDHFNIYEVKVSTKMREGEQRLVSNYIITDIGSMYLDSGT